MMGWDWDWGWGGHMIWGGPAIVIFGFLLIILIVWSVRGLSAGDGRSQQPPGLTDDKRATPLEILQARYARSEISREEYEAIRRDLLSSENNRP